MEPFSFSGAPRKISEITVKLKRGWYRFKNFTSLSPSPITEIEQRPDNLSQLFPFWPRIWLCANSPYTPTRTSPKIGMLLLLVLMKRLFLFGTQSPTMSSPNGVKISVIQTVSYSNPQRPLGTYVGAAQLILRRSPLPFRMSAHTKSNLLFMPVSETQRL